MIYSIYVRRYPYAIHICILYFTWNFYCNTSYTCDSLFSTTCVLLNHIPFWSFYSRVFARGHGASWCDDGTCFYAIIQLFLHVQWSLICIGTVLFSLIWLHCSKHAVVFGCTKTLHWPIIMCCVDNGSSCYFNLICSNVHLTIICQLVDDGWRQPFRIAFRHVPYMIGPRRINSWSDHLSEQNVCVNCDSRAAGSSPPMPLLCSGCSVGLMMSCQQDVTQIQVTDRR